MHAFIVGMTTVMFFSLKCQKIVTNSRYISFIVQDDVYHNVC